MADEQKAKKPAQKKEGTEGASHGGEAKAAGGAKAAPGGEAKAPKAKKPAAPGAGGAPSPAPGGAPAAAATAAAPGTEGAPAAGSAPTAAELLGEDANAKKIVKAKGAKNISVGIANILATFNNTQVNITDMHGN